MHRFLDTLRVGLEAALETILPLRARSARTKSRDIADIPLEPAVHDLLGVRITTLMNYRSAAVQDLVRSLKYDGSRHAARLAAALLEDYLREELASVRLFGNTRVYIIPVPLHAHRAKERGFNQIELVVRALPEQLRNGELARLESDALARTRATKPQTRLPRSERLSNVAGAFALSESFDARGARVFLIDDVTTTGATLANAATPLRRAGADVVPLALARA